MTRDETMALFREFSLVFTIYTAMVSEDVDYTGDNHDLLCLLQAIATDMLDHDTRTTIARRPSIVKFAAKVGGSSVMMAALRLLERTDLAKLKLQIAESLALYPPINSDESKFILDKIDHLVTHSKPLALANALFRAYNHVATTVIAVAD